MYLDISHSEHECAAVEIGSRLAPAAHLSAALPLLEIPPVFLVTAPCAWARCEPDPLT